MMILILIKVLTSIVMIIVTKDYSTLTLLETTAITKIIITVPILVTVMLAVRLNTTLLHPKEY